MEIIEISDQVILSGPNVVMLCDAKAWYLTKSATLRQFSFKQKLFYVYRGRGSPSDPMSGYATEISVSTRIPLRSQTVAAMQNDEMTD